VLLDVDAVLYMPELFSARNPPKLVSTQLLFVGIHLFMPSLTENLVQGHTELYHSYPSRPDIPRPDHLLPSAAVEAKRARIAAAQRSSESMEDEGPLVEKEAEGEARRNDSPRPAMELTEALPLVPQGRRVVRKRKAQEFKSSGY
jgi:hypothetical protein